jgi:hypothetical protein
MLTTLARSRSAPLLVSAAPQKRLRNPPDTPDRARLGSVALVGTLHTAVDARCDTELARFVPEIRRSVGEARIVAFDRMDDVSEGLRPRGGRSANLRSGREVVASCSDSESVGHSDEEQAEEPQSETSEPISVLSTLRVLYIDAEVGARAGVSCVRLVRCVVERRLAIPRTVEARAVAADAIGRAGIVASWGGVGGIWTWARARALPALATLSTAAALALASASRCCLKIAPPDMKGANASQA